MGERRDHLVIPCSGHSLGPPALPTVGRQDSGLDGPLVRPGVEAGCLEGYWSVMVTVELLPVPERLSRREGDRECLSWGCFISSRYHVLQQEPSGSWGSRMQLAHPRRRLEPGPSDVNARMPIAPEKGMKRLWLLGGGGDASARVKARDVGVSGKLLCAQTPEFLHAANQSLLAEGGGAGGTGSRTCPAKPLEVLAMVLEEQLPVAVDVWKEAEWLISVLDGNAPGHLLEQNRP